MTRPPHYREARATLLALALAAAAVALFLVGAILILT